MRNDNELTGGTMKHMGKTLGWLTLRLLEIVLKVDMHAKALLKHKGIEGDSQGRDPAHMLCKGSLTPP